MKFAEPVRTTMVAIFALLSFFSTEASAQKRASSPEFARQLQQQYFYDQNAVRREQYKPFVYRGLQDQKEAFYIADAFARCAVKLNDDMAMELLDAAMSERGSFIDTEQDYYDRLKGCAIRRAYIDREFMRGSLAAHLITKDEKYEDVDAVKSADELLDYLEKLEVASRNFSNDLTSTQIGFECRAAIVPWAAYDVIKEKAGSAEEAEAIMELIDLTPLCDQFFQGEGLSIWFQRSFLARGLYHWNQYRETHPILEPVSEG